MCREIKFRAWVNDHWVDWIPTCKTLGAYNASIIDTDGYTFEEDNPSIVEQYTGLKDKNGKEIYEGDIVALLFGYVPMKSVTTENIRIENAQKAVIHFDTARAAFRYTIKLRIPKDCQFKPGTKTNMVVIGNIHENPELLGGKE